MRYHPLSPRFQLVYLLWTELVAGGFIIISTLFFSFVLLVVLGWLQAIAADLEPTEEGHSGTLSAQLCTRAKRMQTPIILATLHYSHTKFFLSCPQINSE